MAVGKALRMYYDAGADNAISDVYGAGYLPSGREARIKEALRQVYQKRAIRYTKRAHAAGITDEQIGVACVLDRSNHRHW